MFPSRHYHHTICNGRKKKTEVVFTEMLTDITLLRYCSSSPCLMDMIHTVSLILHLITY